MSATLNGDGAASSLASVQEVSLRSSPSNAVSGDNLPVSDALTTQAVAFSSGNPRIEETRGILHLYPEDSSGDSSPPHLPIGRKPLVCVLAVPNHMTYADFCRFCGSFIQHMMEMRIVRNDDVVDQYSVIIRFDEQSSTDNFYQHFNGRKFSSLEVDVCHVRYTVDIQYTGSIEHAQNPVTSSAEQPSCPVCLERLDQDTSGILTTICNHSFHCSCISKWTDSSCPVCRYCQQQPEKSTCSVCGTSENLWICVICGFVGCGRYREGHAIIHWKDTQHCYSLELETQRVWDYVGDNYVHRLIQSKTDGKLVELNFHDAHAEGVCGTCECITDSNFNEALVNSKIALIDAEYNDLLKTQLENQRKHYESCLLQIKEETEKEKSEAIEKAIRLKLHKLQANLDRCVEEKRFLHEINVNLVKNQDMWKAQLLQIEEREQASVKRKDEKIQILEKQLQDLLLQIDSPNGTNDDPAGSTDTQGEDITTPLPAASSGSGINKL